LRANVVELHVRRRNLVRGCRGALPHLVGARIRCGLAVLVPSLVLALAAPSMASPEDAITPVEQYTTAKARSLALTYRPQLLQFYDDIYHCLPWLGVLKNGIGFRQPKGAESDERYLSLWISIDQSDDGRFAQVPLERRVSAMFSRYGVDMLRRMAQIGGIAADVNVSGFSVVLSWLKPGTGRDIQPVAETLALFTDKHSLAEFLAKRLPASEFINRAKFSVFDGKELVGRVPLDVWEDNFNSTFKLKNYELAKGKKC
jgi:hypothetical protein